MPSSMGLNDPCKYLGKLLIHFITPLGSSIWAMLYAQSKKCKYMKDFPTENIPEILYIKCLYEDYYFINKTGDILPGDILEGYDQEYY